MRRRHDMPFGASPLEDGGVRFALWAPAARSVAVEIGEDAPDRFAMAPQKGGWFQLETDAAAHGSRYRFLIDGQQRVPDPASRHQPCDVHGASRVVDPVRFNWRDGEWRGRPWEETVLYELHPGTFTPEGGFDGIQRRLDHLESLGVTAVELMPVADWPGTRNWGYDGVYPYAPDDRLGGPDGLKAMVQAAHERGLMVFLDVVYNHFGPEGNYLNLYAPQFFTGRHETPWGKAINFDGEDCEAVRAFFVHNALYWIEEYGIDGLRLDAVHAIADDSETHILTEIARAVHDAVPADRRVHMVLENDDNAARFLSGDNSSPDCYVAQWNDDVHHAYHVLLTGESYGYYEDYADRPAERLGRSLTEGFAYQGEASHHRGGRSRGERSDHLPPTAFVSFLQNHDQVGNRAFGERIDELAHPRAVEAALTVLLLAPSPPLLFMGQEWGTLTRFPFFCDFGEDLAEAVREGRRREFARFPEFADEVARRRIPDPNAEATWQSAVLDWAEAERPPHAGRLALCRRLLTLRRREIAPRLAGTAGHAGHFRLLGEKALEAAWRLGDGATAVLAANFGGEAVERVGIPQGAPLFASADEPAEVQHVPGWSAIWHLVQAGDGAGLG